MAMFSADDRCVRCGLCAELCVRGIIGLNKPDKPFVRPEDENNCIQCGQCVVFCPKSCCRLDFQPEADRVPVHPSRLPDAETAELFLRSRRSVRKFEDRPVDEGMLRRIMETVRYAPTASNSQLVRWSIVGTRAKTVEIGAMVVETMRRIADPALAGKYRGVIDAWDKGVDSIFRGAPELAIARIDEQHRFPNDADLALTYFELAAHANGIGCCWAGYFIGACRRNPDLSRLVGARDGEIVVGAQMFGYPRKSVAVGHLLPPRKKPDVTFI